MICFDLDGTLLDTIKDMAYSMNNVLKKHGYETNSVSDYISFIGNGAKKLVERSLHNKLDEFDLIYNEYINEYKKNQTNLTTPLVKIDDLLKLKENHKLSIISNKPDSDVKRIVDYYFKGIFDYVSGNKENVLHKPNRALYDEMVNELGLDEEVIYIGDSMIDFEFAKNCNMKFIGVTYGYGNFDENIKTVSSIKEILLWK